MASATKKTEAKRRRRESKAGRRRKHSQARKSSKSAEELFGDKAKPTR